MGIQITGLYPNPLVPESPHLTWSTDNILFSHLNRLCSILIPKGFTPVTMFPDCPIKTMAPRVPWPQTPALLAPGTSVASPAGPGDPAWGLSYRGVRREGTEGGSIRKGQTPGGDCGEESPGVLFSVLVASSSGILLCWKWCRDKKKPALLGRRKENHSEGKLPGQFA